MKKNHEPIDSEINKETEEKVRKRIESLLPDKSDIPTPISIQQVEKLNARIRELEAQLAGQTNEVSSIPAHTAQTVMAGTGTSVHQTESTTIPVSLNPPTKTPAPSQKGISGFVRNLFRAPTFEEPSKNRVASLQNTILWSLLFTYMVIILLLKATDFQTFLVVVLAPIAALAFTLFLLKRGYIDAVAWLIVGVVALSIGVSTVVYGYNETVPLSVVTLIALTSLVIRRSSGVLYTNIAIVLMFAALLYFRASGENLLFLLLSVSTISALLTVASFTLNRTLSDVTISVHKIQQTNIDLQDLSLNLESRTKDIQLASEIGRVIAEKVTDVNEMLENAMELIRERFDLYYTQVYLLDPSERTIVLRAGTGDVGRQLLNRGHRLLVNANSLNGRAVVEKRPVIVADTKKDESFLPNPLLPNTRSEMAIPLIIGKRIIGTLDMQSVRPNDLSETSLSAFETLAGLLAVAIQNSRLFAESSEARRKMEMAIGSITSSGWQDFLNGIDRKDKIGFIYAHSQITPLDKVAEKDASSDFNVPISVEGNVIGEIQAVEDGRIWTPEEKRLVQSASEQLARHIDSLRLVAQSRQYRQQAEDVARRLTREGWQEFLTGQKSLGQGFAYNKNQVVPLAEEPDSHLDNALSEPIIIRDEAIGELAVDFNDQTSDDSKELIATVASQLSNHIENLRLLEQAEQRRIEAETLLGNLRESEARYSAVLSQANDGAVLIQDNIIKYVNIAMANLLGYAPSEMENKPIIDFIAPESRALIVNRIKDRLSGKEVASFYEANLLRKDGTSVEVELSAGVIEYLGKPADFGFARDITERKKAEIALKEGEARLRTLVENAPEAILVVDLPTGLFREPNENAVKLYGLSREELAKVGPAEMSPLTQPDGRPSVEKAMEKINEAMEGGTPVFEWMHRNAQGQDILCEIRLVRLPGDRPQVRASVTDITERKKAENALRESEARYSAVLSQASDGAVLIQNNVIQYLNQALADMLGYSIAELENQSIIKIIAPESRSLVTSRMEARVAGKEVPPVYEAKMQRKDGTIVETEISAGIIEYSGKPADFAFLRDITERKKAQDAIARRATELATVATVSTTTSTVLDPDELLQSVVDLTKERFGMYHAHIYLINEKIKELVLTSGAGNVGRQMVSAGHSISMDAEVSLVARSAREQKAVIVNDVRSESGFLPNPRLPETRSEMAVPMIVGDKVLGVFDVQSDTINHFTEQDANIYTTLASQVAVALQNARLFTEINETAERLREVDKMKSEFLANMSHELRTPLNSVIGYSEILLTGIDGELDDEKQADVQAIYENAKHLLTLINDVLDLAKIEAGRLVLKKELVNIGDLIENVKNNNFGLIHTLKKPVELVTEIGEGIPSTFVDPVRISQVLNNLVSNAIKFSEKGIVTIRATHENDWLSIEVVDQGIGIAQEDINRIFERFAQVDGSTTRRVEGTGLGLPITYHLVEMHGGSLTVESELGKGSKFIIHLPVSKEPIPA